MNETLMTEPAATTPEGQDASTTAAVDAAVTQSTATNTAAIQQPTHEETTSDAKTEVKADGAPGAYADFTMPEGVQMDAAAVASFSTVARDLNMSQEAAQTMIDKMAPAMASRQAELITQARNDWATAATSDKEFGGDNLQANLAVAKQAMDQFGSPELRTLLNESGLGNHPEIIRAFYRAGKAISEDGFVGGRGGAEASSDPAKRLFPNQA